VKIVTQPVLKPGDTIGILGGGQLGRMLAMAASRLGLRCQVFSPDPDSPAFDVVQNATCAEYADVEALELFANDCDVITYEFENIPAGTAMILAARKPVLPELTILQTTQDRLAEKDFVTKLGIGTAAYADIASADELREAIKTIGLPAVLKTRRFGYDGKGQAMIRDGDDLAQVWDDLGTRSAILEAFVPFEREISVVAARSSDGAVSLTSSVGPAPSLPGTTNSSTASTPTYPSALAIFSAMPRACAARSSEISAGA
jgi:5-(carboxyamino)imidazole ribonucleotide synthase